MATACDQCRRVPAGSEMGEKHMWLKLEVPRGIVVHPQDPPEYSGLRRGVSTVYDMHVFCSTGCVQSYIVSKERELLLIQTDSAELMRQAGVLPADHLDPAVDSAPDEYDWGLPS